MCLFVQIEVVSDKVSKQKLNLMMIYLDQYIQHSSKSIASYLSTIEESLDAVDTLKHADKMFHLQQVPNEKGNISLLQYILDKRLTRQGEQLMNVLIKINRSPMQINEVPVENFGNKLILMLEKLVPCSRSKLIVTTLIAYYVMYIILAVSLYGSDLWRLILYNLKIIRDYVWAFIASSFGIVRYYYINITEVHDGYYKDFANAIQNLSLSCPVNRTDYSMYKCWKHLENISKTYQKKLRREQLFF